jgi:hypothetical protein
MHTYPGIGISEIIQQLENLLDLPVSSPWAILRVQFSDQKDSDWPPLSK